MNPSLFERAAEKCMSRKPLGTDAGRYRALEAKRRSDRERISDQRLRLATFEPAKGSRTARLWTQIGDDLGPSSCPHLAKRHLGWRSFGPTLANVGTGGRSQIVSRFESRTWNWRRRPDLNRGSRFCRPLPYHLATAPVGIDCTRGVPAAG